MKTIARISGVIVGSDYDNEFYDEIIGKGVITPASRFIYQVASATDDLEVHINSFGGDVFAGNSMIIALHQWAAAHPTGSLKIIVEAIALSAAANILAKAPRSAVILAYPDSLIMYHSCASVVWGGPGAMKDTAALLDKLNASIVRALLDRTTLKEETIAVWFQDDRMGWLDAAEAQACGLVRAILTGEKTPDKPEEFKDTDGTAPAARIAAFYSRQAQCLQTFTIQQRGQTMPANEETEKKEETLEETQQEQTQEETEKKETEETTEETEETKETEETTEETEKKESEEVTQLKAEMESLRQELKAAKAKLAKLTQGLGAPTQQTEPQKTFAEMLQAIPKDASVYEQARILNELKKAHPQAYKDYMNSHTKTTVR